LECCLLSVPDARLAADGWLWTPVDRHETRAQRSMALPLPIVAPDVDGYRLAPHRIRRCTFRRLIQADARERIYDVECLVVDRKTPLPLGDLESATPICNTCTARHIFRPDED
jgi:hypothetical protein